MSSHIIKLLKEDLSRADCPDYVCMDKKDALMLVEMIEAGALLAETMEHFAGMNMAAAKLPLENWRKKFFIEV
jgi:hydroxypyruvate isomerase